jgi:integrase
MQRNRTSGVRRTSKQRETRKAKGEGTVYESTYDGYWKTELTINGTTIKRSSRSEDDARAKLAELIRQRDEGLDMGSDQQTLGQYLAVWLRDVKQPSMRPHSYASYRSRLEHVRTALGKNRLFTLKPGQITALYAALHRSGFEPSTVAGVHLVLKAALGDAVKANLLTRNPADAAVVPRVPRKRMETFSADDVGRMIEFSRGTRWCALWALMATTGLRVGEATGLVWSDIEGDVAQIQRAVSWDDDGHLELAETKTDRSRRRIELPALVVSALAAHRLLQVETQLETKGWKDRGLVFPNTHGGIIQCSAVRDAWIAMLDELTLSRLRLHDLRHTAASLLLQKGVHPKVVQEMLGHSSITITLDRYSHVIPAMHREAAQTMDSLLGVLDFAPQTPKITPDEAHIDA